MRTKLISIVIPCYYSSKMIEKVVDEIRQELFESRYHFEIILVNDASKDNTWEVLKGLSQKYQEIVAINLAKNFGQHAATMAGIRNSKGDIIVTMDDDGQVPTEYLCDLISAVEGEADVAFGKYEQQDQKVFYRRIGSMIDTKMCEILLGKPHDLFLSTFMAAKRYVIEEMKEYQGAYPYIAGLVLRTTDRIVNVPVKHRQRIEGTSGYSFAKLLRLWMNGFTAFSVLPLRVASIIGAIVALGGFGVGIWTVIQKVVNPDIVIGYSSIVCSILFIGGMLMLMLGMLGEYIGRIYISLNKSPQYVEREIARHKFTKDE